MSGTPEASASSGSAAPAAATGGAASGSSASQHAPAAPAASSATPDPSASPGTSQQKPARPEALPETYWNAEKGEVDFGKLGETLKTAEQLTADRITDPETFQWQTTVKDLAGEPITINAQDPLVKGILKVGAEHGVSGKAMNAIADAFLTAQLASHAAEKAEFEKLGETGTQRFNAVLKQGGAIVGEREMAQILGLVGTAEQFTAVEKLIGALNGPRAAETGAGDGNSQEPMYKRWYSNDLGKGAN